MLDSVYGMTYLRVGNVCVFAQDGGSGSGCEGIENSSSCSVYLLQPTPMTEDGNNSSTSTSTDSGGLSAAAIAGITVGTVTGVVVLAAVGALATLVIM